MQQTLDKYDLTIHNFDSITHIDTTSNSNIDLIITNKKFVTKLEAIVHDETYGSDHYPISININAEKSIYIKKSIKIRSMRTNWKKVELDLGKEYIKFFCDSYVSMSADDKYDLFVQIVTEAVTSNTPKKKVVDRKVHRNPVPWWDEACDTAKQLRNAAFKKWEKTKLLVDYIEFKKLRTVPRRTFKTKKKKKRKFYPIC